MKSLAFRMLANYGEGILPASLLIFFCVSMVLKELLLFYAIQIIKII